MWAVPFLFGIVSSIPNWNLEFQLREGGKIRIKEQDQPKFHVNPLTQISWEKQRMLAKNETLSGSGGISGPLVCNKLLTFTDSHSGPVEEPNINYLPILIGRTIIN